MQVCQLPEAHPGYSWGERPETHPVQSGLQYTQYTQYTPHNLDSTLGVLGATLSQRQAQDFGCVASSQITVGAVFIQELY